MCFSKLWESWSPSSETGLRGFQKSLPKTEQNPIGNLKSTYFAMSPKQPGTIQNDSATADPLCGCAGFASYGRRFWPLRLGGRERHRHAGGESPKWPGRKGQGFLQGVFVFCVCVCVCFFYFLRGEHFLVRFWGCYCFFGEGGSGPFFFFKWECLSFGGFWRLCKVLRNKENYQGFWWAKLINRYSSRQVWRSGEVANFCCLCLNKIDSA